MTIPTAERPEKEKDAERALRRGELKSALQMFRELASTWPDEPAYSSRVATIESLLHPSELGDRAAAPPPAAEPPRTPEQLAEALLDRGDYAGCIASYERILRARPNHALARERLQEIRTLVDAGARNVPQPSLPADKKGMLDALLLRITARRRA